MCVSRYPVRLSLTQEEAERYVPPKGIDVSWIKWEKPDVVVAEFGCSEVHPNPIYRKTAQDLRHEVGTTFRNRILTDNLFNYPMRARRFMMVFGILEHPFIAGRGVEREVKRAADIATERRDVEMTKEQVQYMAQVSGVKESTIEAKEVRHRRAFTPRHRPDGSPIEQEESGPLEEVQVFTGALIDVG